MNSTHYGYWAYSSDALSLNFTDLSEHGVTDILLNYYAYERFNQSFVESFALDAKEHGINIHIWAQIFYEGSWIRPVDRQGNVNYDFFDTKTAELEGYARTKGIAGIHYDYLRFSGSEYYSNTGWQNPGGKEAITYFVRQSTEAIRKINPDLIISAAIMPEYENLEYTYGVQYSEISKYFDVIMPMSYRGNYNKDTEWIKSVTQDFVDNSQGSEVWAGLQGYVDDDHSDNTLPVVEMINDTAAALDAGAKGVMVFKVNCCENIDFNNLTVDENQYSSFEYLYYKTSSAIGTLNLENDFAFNETTDNEFINGVNVYQNNLIINGNNHVIDGKNLARIFNIQANDVVLMNIQFKNAFTNGSGGAFHITGSNVKLINCTFIDNSAESKGAAVYLEGNGGYIDNCTFINSFTNDTGAAVYVDANSVNIINSTFKDNSAQIEAAAIFLIGTGGNINNCTFINNTAEYTGAVLIRSMNACIRDSYFENNTAEISAAAIGMGVRSNMKIENCVFVNNAAYNEGGAAIFVNNALNAKIINSTFIDNFAHYYGGGIFWSYGNNGCLINSTFINNTATEKGGAIYHIGNNITMTGNVFMDNVCVNGSAIYLNNGSNNVLSRNILVSNDLYLNNIDDSQIQNSIILDKIISNNSTVLFTNNWFGNTKDNYNESLNDFADNWLYLNATSDNEMVGQDASIKFHFDQYNSSESFDLPEITLKLFGDNVILASDSVSIDESVNAHVSDYGAYVNASFENITFKYEFPTADINIFADNVTKYCGNPQRFIVTVLDANANPLSNKTVNITLNGVDYIRVSDENGSASIGLNLNSGAYNVTVCVDNMTIQSGVTVLSTVDAHDVIKVFRNESQYYAVFKDINGNALTNANVSFNINGVTYVRSTDDNGGAKLNINLMAGEYVITATNPVTGEMHANNITVLSRFSGNSDLVKYYRNASQYSVKVIGDDGNPVGAGETVTFNINGVFYTRTTDESGNATLNINLAPGEYIVTAEYKGCMISNNIAVKPVLSASDLNMSYNDGSKFTARLLDGQGMPYANQSVSFNVNGVIYNRITDINGEAKLGIHLMPGEYIITSSYNDCGIANKITVR